MKRAPTAPRSAEHGIAAAKPPGEQEIGRMGAVGNARTSGEQTCAKVDRAMCNAVGVGEPLLAADLLGQAANVQVWGILKNDDKLAQALGLMRDIKPAGAMEAMLAVQMFGVHHAALLFLRRASLDGQTLEGADANVLRATRLLRLFNEQLEAMAKLKGKTAQQRVTVEHVHVHEGGQAIVGAMSTRKGDPGGGVK
jgi:hypothetical protein